MSEQQRNIYNTTLDGGQVLVFDTALDARAFARANIARFLPEAGLIVFPDGRREEWKAGGVVQSDAGGKAAMLVWGPAFYGERLDALINGDNPDAALAAVGAWVSARIALHSRDTEGLSFSPRPAAAFTALPHPGNNPETDCLSPDGGFYPEGTIFFAPEKMTARCVQAEGEDAFLRGIEQYTHPDLTGERADVFTAAAMLYRVFSGVAPFTAAIRETLRADMREGNFLPVRLASPGLDEKLARLIQGALTCRASANTVNGEPLSLAQLRDILLSAPPVRGNYIQEPPLGRAKKIARERQTFEQKKKMAVRSRRFIARNRFPIALCAALIVIAFLFVTSVVRGRADKPGTAGMEPAQVINTYYTSFEDLDHQMMEACVARGAGRNDINMVSSLFVMGKVRQAYEPEPPRVIPASEWENEGFPATNQTVFGVIDLELAAISQSADSARFRAVYTICLPREGGTERQQCGDELELAKIKDAWRIVRITRTELQ